MPIYHWRGPEPRPDVDSDQPLGYPWVAADSLETEIAAGTADAILAEVGEDVAKAQAALDAENKRDAPRVGLTRKLERIIANG